MKKPLELGPRRGYALDATQIPDKLRFTPDAALLKSLDELNLFFRTLCSVMYNCVPKSGHPGGSISSSFIVESLLYHTLDVDFSNPHAIEADVLSYAAGHKALGLYAMLALRNEIVRIVHPEMLPDEKNQLRLEDLLGFRKNPTQSTPLFKKLKAKPLDGHPTPATPFVRLSTGASGVGLASSFGLAFSGMDLYPDDPPRVHVIEGEGGLTPGRIHEALANAGSSGLNNIFLHIDWNQASIDTNRVCREGDTPGDYVQWDPIELARFHDFNVIYVEDGLAHAPALTAQDYALKNGNTQPTIIVYKTVKGWKYGIEGRASHGAGHDVCSEQFYASLGEFEKRREIRMPRHEGKVTDESLERHDYDLLMTLRGEMEKSKELFKRLGDAVADSKKRLAARKRTMRADAPNLDPLYYKRGEAAITPSVTPGELVLKPGEKITLRDTLGKVLAYLNTATGGGIIAASADLIGSTSLIRAIQAFTAGFYNAQLNPKSRLISYGGICEDAMGAFLSAVSASGRHIGAGSSYGAFIAPLQHVAARLHAISQQARQHAYGADINTYIMVCAHVGLDTGEDGPTHADPQCLQLLMENFPRGLSITLTPWDPNEIWPLVVEGLQKRPALLAPFVTRPPVKVPDRAALGLPPVEAAIKGIYALHKADPGRKARHGTLVFQGGGVAMVFMHEVLPRLKEAGLDNLNAYYVTSPELFDMLPAEEQEAIYPEAHAREAMGVTGFTLSTLYRWITSNEGRRESLHAFGTGHYMGSGQPAMVYREAGLDADGQFAAISRYARKMAGR